MKIGILKGFDDRHEHYVDACKELGIDYEVIDLRSYKWIEMIKNSNCDGFMHMPNCIKQDYKDMYDQKLYFINKVMNKPIYPGYTESLIYESKRGMAYWLEINGYKHADTFVFYDKEEALKFVDEYENWPLYFKTNIGSGAIGVKQIKSKLAAKRIIKKIFSINRFYGRGYTKWNRSTRFPLIAYPLMDDKQHNCVIFQEAINAKVEWRMIKVGDSYFGHQKLSKDGFFSGSGRVGWVQPPVKLLNMIKDLCEKAHFDSMDLDIFEDYDGNYWINEMQTIFGSYNHSQMYINDVPGRFVFENNEWKFEEGIFNKNYSCNLRVESFVKQLSK